MNRQIKIKFWLGHTRKMTYPHTLQEIHKIIPEFTEDIIPLEFTGRLDRHGKEIYDCDLIRCEAAISGSKTSRVMIGQVNQCVFGWTISLWHKNEWWAYGKMDFRTVEVIGNIYENPELINAN